MRIKMSNEKSSYRQVFKATSIFGGVQIFKILISILKSKAVSYLLGSQGMGVLGMFTTTLNLIGEIFGLGLHRSAVKEISAKNSEAYQNSKPLIASLTTLLWFLGIIGTVLTIIFSPFLSRLVFNSSDYTFAFWWIALAVFFQQLSNGNFAILQGLRKLNKLARANLISSLISLIFIIPLYYFFGINAIAPSLLLAFVISFLVSHYYLKPFKLANRIKLELAFKNGKPLFRLGIMMSVSRLLVILFTFLLQVFINEYASIEEVGYYHAGMLIINSYVGVVFTAMGTDYFPRLSSVANDIHKLRETVKQQAYIAILIITPFILFFLIVEKIAVIILYSKEFLPMLSFLTWAIGGTIFKAVSFSMGYILLAKGDSNLFLKTTVFFNLLLFTLNISGYYFFGLEGLGISFCVYYILHLLLIGILTKKKYNFYFPARFNLTFLACVTLCILSFTINYFYKDNFKFLYLGVLLFVSVIGSFYLLNKELDFLEKIRSYLKK